jgi:hypothetical protein
LKIREIKRRGTRRGEKKRGREERRGTRREERLGGGDYERRG